MDDDPRSQTRLAGGPPRRLRGSGGAGREPGENGEPTGAPDHRAALLSRFGGPTLPLAVAVLAVLAVIGARAHGALRLSDRGPLSGERGAIVGIGALLLLLDVVAIAAVHMVLRRRRRLRRPPDTLHRFQEPIDPDVRWMRLVQIVATAFALLLPLLLLLVALRPLDPQQANEDPAVTLPGLNPSEAVSRAALWTLVWLAVAVLVVWVLVLLRRMRPVVRRPLVGSAPDEEYRPDADETDLRALESATRAGAVALETSADPRTAIVACYDAMERALAEHGAPRSAWETPTEALHRVAAAGLVRSSAAHRLTGLFEEARFSQHPLGEPDRQAALAALGEIRAEVDRLIPAPSGLGRDSDRPDRDTRGSVQGATGATT